MTDLQAKRATVDIIAAWNIADLIMAMPMDQAVFGHRVPNFGFERLIYPDLDEPSINHTWGTIVAHTTPLVVTAG